MSRTTAIVLAAGNGSRMNSKTKKQFMELEGKPIVWYSLFAFEKSQVDQIILVTAKEDIEYCKKEIIFKYDFTKVTNVVAGGSERYESVYNGLEKVKGDIVLIHDGARPLVTGQIIERCIEGAKTFGACVAGMPVKDTVKIVGENHIIESTPDRNKIWITQTPQAFQYNIIKTAYNNMNTANCNLLVTDDSMVVEQYTNHRVMFVKGDYSNVKITTPEDIDFVKTILSK